MLLSSLWYRQVYVYTRMSSTSVSRFFVILTTQIYRTGSALSALYFYLEKEIHTPGIKDPTIMVRSKTPDPSSLAEQEAVR